MWSQEMTSGDLEITSQFGTWKRMRESFQRLQQLLEVASTVGSYSNCWKLRRVAGEACNMTENALSILIIFSVQFQQTETSDRKLLIFHHGLEVNLKGQGYIC